MHYSSLGTFVLKHWRRHINQESQILQPFLNILKHICCLTIEPLSFSGSFSFRTLKVNGLCILLSYEIFVLNMFFQSITSIHFAPILHNLPTFLNYDLHKKKSLSMLKNLFEQQKPWWLYILILFRIFSSQNIM